MFGSEIVQLEGLTADPIERATVLLAARNLIEAELVEALGAMDADKLTMAVCGLSTNEWVSNVGNTSLRSAKRLTSVGRAVHDRFEPEVLDRVRSGEVSVEHLAVLVQCSNSRIEPKWSAKAGELLDLTDGLTFSTWERSMRRLAKRVDTDGAYDERSDAGRGDLRMTRSGAWLRLEGEFYGEAADAIEAAVKSANDSLWEQFWSDHKLAGVPMPGGRELAAMALHELVRIGRLSRPDGTPRPNAVEVSLVMQLEDGAPVVRTRDGRVLCEEELGRFLCDPTIRAVVVDSLGQPLDMGQRVRLATDDMRAAIAIRDGGCTFPGCSSDGHVDAHHVQHFLSKGPTAVRNLAQLCRRHHGVVHRRGWAMYITNDGWTIFRRPDGLDMWGQQHGLRRTGAIPELPARTDLEGRGAVVRCDEAAALDLGGELERMRSDRDRRAAGPHTRISSGQAGSSWAGGGRAGGGRAGGGRAGGGRAGSQSGKRQGVGDTSGPGWQQLRLPKTAPVHLGSVAMPIRQ